MPPSVSVIIPTYRRARWLRETLQTLVTQDYPADRWELVIVDNNSPDETKAVVAEFAAAPKAPRHVLETRQGANFARNRGVNESTGEIVVFGDDDILVGTDWLRQMVAPFEADAAGRIAAVGGEVVPVFPEGCPDWVRGFHGPQALRPDAGPTRDGQVPMSANLAFRREALVGVGLFDTSVTREGGKQFSSDENVLTRKLRAAGREIWFAPAAVARHQMPAARTTFAYVRRHAFDSARSRVIDRVSEGRGSAVYLLSRFLGNLLKVLGFTLVAGLNALAGRGGEARKALVRAWRSCGYLYQIPRSLVGKR
jgi:glycosyltransferase involved in cell wall biosynthesis